MSAVDPRTAAKFGHRYPWPEWLAAPLPLSLVRGTDFPADVEPSSVSLMLRARVRDAGLRRTIRTTGDRVVMEQKRDRRRTTFSR